MNKAKNIIIEFFIASLSIVISIPIIAMILDICIGWALFMTNQKFVSERLVDYISKLF